ncbi:unnamed protein product [Plutella xylostella]|uniref:Tripeptidyl-peptidase 2 n=1 Tax=Plutella xylostella TaxID=51655 RepID=A0A8S4G829_PLUXY|nr:unnamed protein product [Plutella xylostella]
MMKKLGRISYHILIYKNTQKYCGNNLVRYLTADCVFPVIEEKKYQNGKSSKMADVPIDCDFPVWGLMPKKETGVVSFLNKNPNYDGRGTVIAILDSGVDPAADGLKLTSTGETKVIERFDCSGCGDVDTSTVITKVVDGCITGLTGRQLTIPESWKNPSGEWRVGVLYPYSLYPGKLKERVQEHRKTHSWDVGHKPAFAAANKALQDFETENASSPGPLSPELKLQREELEARVEALQAANRKHSDVGPACDTVLFHDGAVWRACIDTSESGDLSSGPLLGEYSVTHEHTHLTPLDEMTVSINVHNEGNVLEVVGMCSTHGTHVAAISAGYFPEEPDRNGVAPGAKIISLTIGDSRLGSMETGTALVRACIKLMQLSKEQTVHVVNMSYGEHAHWSNAGRVGSLICEVVARYGVCWVVSAGNHGPALCTVGAPPDVHQSTLIGVGAYVSPEMMSAAYSMRARSGGGLFSWSSRGPCADGAAGVSVCAPGAAVAPVARYVSPTVLVPTVQLVLSGAAGVSVCAPGAAVAPVARFTLRNSQLMNGTSMAAPHVAGATAALISGLKAKGLKYSPFSVKRALENSATYLSHVEPWAQGCGLLNIEKAFDILTTHHDAPERDVTFTIECGASRGKGVLLRPRQGDTHTDVAVSIEPAFLHHCSDTDAILTVCTYIECGASRGKGVLLRPRQGDTHTDVAVSIEPAFLHHCSDTDAILTVCTYIECGASRGKGVLLRPRQGDTHTDVAVSIEPAFLHHCSDTDDLQTLRAQISFGLRLTLANSAPWISAPTHLDMMNANRPISIRVDTAALPPGPHFSSIDAYDVNCIEKGPVFRIPVTVFQPEPLDPATPFISCEAEFRPSSIRRHLLVPPPGTTWGVLRISSRDQNTQGRYLVHTMQMLPQSSCRSHETQKMLSVTTDAPAALPFRVVEGVTLEIAIAKYWANMGSHRISYTIELFGLKPSCGRRAVALGAGGLSRLLLAAHRQQDCQPHAQLKHAELPQRPTESKITPLTSRDVVPPNRQIYQLVNTYTFHLAKGTEVTPIVSLLSDMLYESEFESQMWMLYNSCKQLMAVGDAYPSKYSVKLDKGDYTLRLNVRHESKQVLELIAELAVLLQQRLPQPLTADLYCTRHEALTGGKKFNSATVPTGGILPLYLSSIPSDKISRSNLTVGQTLTGTITFTKDELGRKVDTYELVYVVPEPPKRNNNNNKEKEKGNPYEEYLNAMKDFKTNWMAKLEGDKLEQVYEEVQELFPGYLGAHVAYLHAVDSPTDAAKLPHAEQAPDVTPAWCEQLITISDKVIKAIDQDKLLAYLGIKNDTRSDANKIKVEQEKQRGFLIDALCRKGTAICRLLALADSAAAKEKLMTSLKDNMADLLKFTDLTDAKAIHYGVWHCFALKHWGRAIKLLTKIQEDKPSKEVEERLLEAYKQLQWDHLVKYTTSAMPTKYPTTYRPF